MQDLQLKHEKELRVSQLPTTRRQVNQDCLDENDNSRIIQEVKETHTGEGPSEAGEKEAMQEDQIESRVGQKHAAEVEDLENDERDSGRFCD